MNKPKYNIGDTVYLLVQNGISKDEIVAVSVNYGNRYLRKWEQGEWVVEQYLFPTLKACLDFVAESAEKFKEPSTKSNSRLEASKDRKPAKFKAGDKVRFKRDHKLIDTVISVPGMPSYDSFDFESAERGFFLKGCLWELQEEWEIVPKRGRPRKVIS